MYLQNLFVLEKNFCFDAKKKKEKKKEKEKKEAISVHKWFTTFRWFQFLLDHDFRRSYLLAIIKISISHNIDYQKDIS